MVTGRWDTRAAAADAADAVEGDASPAHLRAMRRRGCASMVRLRRICHPEARCQSGDDGAPVRKSSSRQCRADRSAARPSVLGLDVAGARVTGNGDRRMHRVGIATRLAIAATTAATQRATTPAAMRVAMTAVSPSRVVALRGNTTSPAMRVASSRRGLVTASPLVCSAVRAPARPRPDEPSRRGHA